ncbi:MAG: globin [Candidatus Zixiibacteriota bacterium]
MATIFATLRNALGSSRSSIDKLAESFFKILLEKNPTFQPLFNSADMAIVQSAFAEFIGALIADYDDEEEWEARVLSYGEMFASHGLRNTHFEPVSTAFLEALKSLEGDAATDQCRDVWADSLPRITRILHRGIVAAASES